MKISAEAIIAAFSRIEEMPSVKPDRGKAKEALRRFSVARGKVIYVCPGCLTRVKQFDDQCRRCGQRLIWDIRVVK